MRAKESTRGFIQSIRIERNPRLLIKEVVQVQQPYRRSKYSRRKQINRIISICKRLFVLVTLVVFTAEARRFRNPVLDNADYPDPGAIKVGDRYYVVTTTNNDKPEKFPIHTSTDLENWTLVGYVFNASNLPPWSNKDHEYWAPELHKVGDGFRVYFTSRDTDSNHLSIGVATSSNVDGPYRSSDRPIWLDPVGDVLDSTLINDNGTLYLVWKAQYWINARPLNSDGLSFSSDVVTPIFKPDFPWEDNLVEAPFYVRRNQYHYLFYSGHGYCSNLYAVGIARSLNPLGPYEKRGDPILKETDAFPGPGHNSVVKDIDNINDVIVYHAFKKDQVCGPNPRLTLVGSIGWGDDDWPYVYDNS